MTGTFRCLLLLPLLPLLPLLALLAFPSPLSAHRLDEYLQATLVSIEPGDIRLQINFTPGVAVAEQVLALIDRDRDGVISADEAAAYAELLKRDLTARLDQRGVALRLTASRFPAAADLRTGWGIIQIEFALPPAALPPGEHRLALENRHLPAMGAYLFNAAQPRSGAIRITRQNRNENQSLGEIEFTVQPIAPSGHASAASRTVAVVASVAALLVAVLASLWRPGKRSPRSN